MNLNDAWNIDGSFARNYTMFGLLVVVLFCALWLSDIWLIVFILVAILLLFYYLEYDLHKTIDSLVNEEVSTIPRTKYVLFSIVCLLIAALCQILFSGAYQIPSFDPESLSIFSVYSKCLLLSLIFFLLFLAFKLLVVSLDMISLISLKRGIFGLIYRAVVIVRSIVVTPYWVKAFSQSTSASVMDLIMNRRFEVSSIYLMSKFLFLAMLLWDYDSIRRKYIDSLQKVIRKAFVSDSCGICRKESSNPVSLQCGHVFCSKCILKSLKKKPFCPVCHQSPISLPKFSFYDGFTSFSSIFCCF